MGVIAQETDDSRNALLLSVKSILLVSEIIDLVFKWMLIVVGVARGVGGRGRPSMAIRGPN